MYTTLTFEAQKAVIEDLEQSRPQGIKFADCMRSHGVPSFPDPGPGGGGIQINAGINPPSGRRKRCWRRRGGVFIAVPETINAGSPVYTRAAAACRFGIPATAKRATSF